MQSLNDKYISIQGWMVEELKLKGNDLLVYAIIYGFSQDNQSEFTGSLSYLARWCNSTKNGIQKNNHKLLDTIKSWTFLLSAISFLPLKEGVFENISER